MRLDLGHQGAGRPVETERIGHVAREILQIGAEPRAMNFLAAGLRRRDDIFDHIDRNGEANADRTARLRENRRVDADQPPLHVDQRAAGIAGIDRGVGLDEEAIVGDADLGAREGRHNALRHRLADAKGIADGQRQIADFDGVGIAQFKHRKVFLTPLDAQHGEIAARIAQQNLRREFAPVRQAPPSHRSCLR